MKIQLSDHFNYKKLLRFTLPSIIMMIFTSIYNVIDGFFVSNFAGKDEFTALNLIFPYLMIFGAVGFMFGAGGSALVSKTLGENDKEKANRTFSLIVYTTLLLGVVLLFVCIFTITPVARLLGAEGEMLRMCQLYGIIVISALPFLMSQFLFQSFFVTAEKPGLGLKMSIIAGVTNIVLDFLFIAIFKWGIVGAALATATGQVVGGIAPLIYFGKKNDSLLKLTKTKFDGPALIKSCTNGSSEFFANISMSVVGLIYNWQLMNYAGADGVAAYGVLMYINFIFIAIIIGYSVGTAPIVGYHYGAKNTKELKNILKKSMIIISITSIVMVILGELLAYPLSVLYVSYDKALFDMTMRGFIIYSFGFLFAGFSIFGSSFFTALNNGLVSAIISTSRTAVFQIVTVFILPLFLGLDGIWLSMVMAELLAAVMAIVFIIGNKKKYQY